MKERLTAPEISLIVPTYNERGNIARLLDSVREALGDIPWEMIVVDDDSPDQTFNEVSLLAREEPRLRCLRRVGRRGLSSAVIEGALVANGAVIAVMDADFQHDERILRPMFDKLIATDSDLVVATRYTEGGGIGDWDAKRARMSDFATRMARMLIGNQTTDPMSGFFMVPAGLQDIARHHQFVPPAPENRRSSLCLPHPSGGREQDQHDGAGPVSVPDHRKADTRANSATFRPVQYRWRLRLAGSSDRPEPAQAGRLRFPHRAGHRDQRGDGVEFRDEQ
jgi:hypothetical protein